MKFSNIYLGFDKMKNELTKNIVLQKEIGYEFGMSDCEINSLINKYLGMVIVYQEKRRVVCELPTAHGYGYSQTLLLIVYRGYKHLFVVCDNNCIWINYETVNADICKKRNNLWEYLPQLDEKIRAYRIVGETKYYVVNTYKAFLKFGKCVLNKEQVCMDDNYKFYGKVKEALLSGFSNLFFEDENGGWLNCVEKIEEREHYVELQEKYRKIVFRFLFADNLIIVTDCECIYYADVLSISTCF